MATDLRPRFFHIQLFFARWQLSTLGDYKLRGVHALLHLLQSCRAVLFMISLHGLYHHGLIPGDGVGPYHLPAHGAQRA